MWWAVCGLSQVQKPGMVTSPVCPEEEVQELKKTLDRLDSEITLLEKE